VKDFQETLLKQLADPKLAAAYLNEHAQFKGPGSQELLLDAIRNVLKAQGVDKVSKKSGISRRTLYHAVSSKGNPSVDLFFKILDELKLQVQFSPRGASGRRRKAA
jgi:probable addiction module antidote protein